MAIVFVVAYCNKKRKTIFLFSYGVLVGLFLWVKGKEILDSALTLANGYLELRGRYLITDLTDGDYLGFAALVEPRALSVFLLFFASILLVVWILVLFSNHFKLVAGLLMMIPLFLTFCIGKMPSAVSCWMILFAGGLFYNLVNKGTSKNLLLQSILTGVMLTLLILFSSWIQPSLVKTRNTYQEEYYKIKTVMQREVYLKVNKLRNLVSWDGNFATAGVGNGSLTNLSSNRSLGTKDLEVTLDQRPQTAIYLKGYVGGDYTGTAWNPIGNATVNQLFDELAKVEGDTLKSSKEEMSRALFQLQYQWMKQEVQTIGTEASYKGKMKIKVLGANKDYTYLPYFSKLNDNMKVSGESYVEGTKEKEYEIEYFPMWTIGLSTGDMQFLNRPAYWWEYQDYVYKNYTTYPSHLTRLKEAGDQIENDPNYVPWMIKEILYQDTEYNLNPGPLPTGKDFAEYFLFDNKKGFCVHYATTGVLLNRIKELPSRYVGGYVIAPNSFKKQPDETYKAIVTDAMANAWAETYSDSYGWIYQEYTKSYERVNEESFDQSVEAHNGTLYNQTQNGNDLNLETKEIMQIKIL